MRARAVALAGLLLLLRAAAAADDARIAVVGDDGRFGLGNVVLGASSAVVYAAHASAYCPMRISWLPV